MNSCFDPSVIAVLTMNRTRCLLSSVVSHAQRTQKLKDITRQTLSTTVPTSAFHDYPNAQTETENKCPKASSPDILSSAENDSLSDNGLSTPTPPPPPRPAPPPPPDPWRSISAGESNLIVGGQPFSLKCGHVARFADGAAVCKIGHTAVLVTAVGAKPEPGSYDVLKESSVGWSFERYVFRAKLELRSYDSW